MAIKTSTNTELFDEAFAKAQAKFEAAAKSALNPAYRSKYADISSIIEATLEHLNSEGIGVRQHPSFEYKGEIPFITITTRLSYKGQWEESDLSLPAMQRERFDPQSCGSAVTYGCRYSLQGIFCVRREDDDGNAASGIGSKDAAQDVAKTKIAAAAKAGSKTAQKIVEGNGRVTSLFYILPEKHNGNFAEFVNIPAFLSSNEDKQDMLRFAFSANGAKKTKEETTLVPTDKMETLLQVLAGDCGVDVHLLKEAK